MTQQTQRDYIYNMHNAVRKKKKKKKKINLYLHPQNIHHGFGRNFCCRVLRIYLKFCSLPVNKETKYLSLEIEENVPFKLSKPIPKWF